MTLADEFLIVAVMYVVEPLKIRLLLRVIDSCTPLTLSPHIMFVPEPLDCAIPEMLAKVRMAIMRNMCFVISVLFVVCRSTDKVKSIREKREMALLLGLSLLFIAW